MPIAVHTLAVGEEPLRQDMMQTVLGPCHGDVEQPAFLLDFRRCSSAEIGGNAAVNDIQHKDGFPLLSFCGMNCREDQVILIQHRHPGLIACGVRRVERALGQKARPRRIACGNVLELQQVGLANGRILVNAFEMRLIPATCMADLGGPAGLPRTNGLEGVYERIPIIARPRRGWDIGQRSQRIGVGPPSDREHAALTMVLRRAVTA